jgi:acyl-CoA synthetase (AMP-forming)/AMP-acid ligase II
MTYKLENYTLMNQLKWRSMHLPKRLALCYLADGETETESLTYKDLDVYATKIAATLQSHNLTSKPVLMLYSSGLEFVKAFFGCLYAGVIAVPTYIPKSQHILKKIEGIQQDCGAEAILTTQSMIDENYLNNSKLSDLLILATDRISTEKQMNNYNELSTSSEDIVFIQYTSGSTSNPKGARVSNHNIMANQVMLQHVFELNENSVGVTWLPLFHDMGLIASLLNAIFVGYPIYIMPPAAFIRKPVRWLQCISKYKGTYTCAPNFAYDLCIKNITLQERAELDLSSLKKAINAAEPVQPATLEEFTKQFSACGFREEAFTPAYGLAEATVFVTGKSDSVIKYVYVKKEALKANRVSYSESPVNAYKMVSCGNANYLGQKIKIINPSTLREGYSQRILK